MLQGHISICWPCPQYINCPFESICKSMTGWLWGFKARFQYHGNVSQEISFPLEHTRNRRFVVSGAHVPDVNNIWPCLLRQYVSLKSIWKPMIYLLRCSKAISQYSGHASQDIRLPSEIIWTSMIYWLWCSTAIFQYSGHASQGLPSESIWKSIIYLLRCSNAIFQYSGHASPDIDVALESIWQSIIHLPRGSKAIFQYPGRVSQGIRFPLGST